MKQFEIVTEPIQTELYRHTNEHQGAVVVLLVMLENGQRESKSEYEAYTPMAEKNKPTLAMKLSNVGPAR